MTVAGRRPALAETKLSAFGVSTLKRLRQKRERRERAAEWLLHLEKEHEKRMQELEDELQQDADVTVQLEEDMSKATKLYKRFRKLAGGVPEGEAQLWAEDTCWRAGIDDIRRSHFTDEYRFVKAVHCVATTIQRTWRAHRHVKRMKEERRMFVKFLKAVEGDSRSWVSRPPEHTSFLPLLASIAQTRDAADAQSTQANTDSGKLLRHQTWDRKWEKFSAQRSVSMPGKVSLEKVGLPALSEESNDMASYLRGAQSRQATSKRTQGSAPAARSAQAPGWREALTELNLGQKPPVVGLGNYNPPAKPPPQRKLVSTRLPDISPKAAQKNAPQKQESKPKDHRRMTGGRQLLNPVMF
eukprot:jgi/Tetstr1/432474/TSEL_021850.t1